SGLANVAGPQQRRDLAYGHGANAHTITRETVAAVRAPGDNRGDLDDSIRAWRRHLGDVAELRDWHEPVGHILVKKAMIDSGRRLDPAVRLAVVENIIGCAAVSASRVRVSHAKEELWKRFDAHTERGRNRETLGVERIDQATDAWRDTVIIVVVVATGRLHAADIE